MKERPVPLLLAPRSLDHTISISWVDADQVYQMCHHMSQSAGEWVDIWAYLLAGMATYFQLKMKRST